MRIKVLITSLILSLIPLTSSAQEITDEFRADVIQMMEASGSLQVADQLSQAIIQQMAAAARAANPGIDPRALEIQADVVTEHMSNFIRSPALIEGTVEMYSKYLSHEEIKEVIVFYKTPAGSKIISIQPQLTQESVQLTQSLLPSVIPMMQIDLQQRLDAEGLSLQP